MMNKKRTQSIGQLKYLLFLPVAALLAAACAGNSNKQDTTTAQPEAVEAAKPETPAESTVTVQSPIGETAEGETNNMVESEVYNMVEEAPQFPGGVQELMKYLGKNLKYPVAAQNAGKQGNVVCQFVVKSDGTIGDIKVVRSISPELDEEAIRVIKAMPAWTPGKKDGKAVNVRYTLPVAFRLQ